ncbi:LysR family transcriptional regulator [Bordetella genomosp. 9]|uniref:LysR family transcriptional regulator n=1 Tax=Bordetella genomosp. 9 TaxID=1416803 RepID=UPI00211B3149|nr:LysR family transcriptional regulator [Bordetella genomosp. 9]
MRLPQLHYSLRQLRYFVAAAETLSFTAAAKALHISQPSMSTALAELESSFGVQLFIRHHASGLSLTQAGQEMLGRARALLKNAEELQNAARDIDAGLSGDIALGCLTSLAPPLLPGLISRFMKAHTGISFRTREAPQNELLDGLYDGSLDVALTYDIDTGDTIDFQPLLTLPPYVILPKNHPLASRRTIPIPSLLTVPYVMLDLPHSREYFSRLFDSLGERPTPVFQSAQPEVVRGLVANGLGYSILNFPLKSTRTVDGAEFAVRPFSGEVGAITLGIAQAGGMKPRRAVQQFAAYCGEYIRTHYKRRAGRA